MYYYEIRFGGIWINHYVFTSVPVLGELPVDKGSPRILFFPGIRKQALYYCLSLNDLYVSSFLLFSFPASLFSFTLADVWVGAAW
jgi:hypothetical protein